MADKDFKVKSGLDLGTPLPLTEGGTGQTSANNGLNALLPVQTSANGQYLKSDGTNSSWSSIPSPTFVQMTTVSVSSNITLEVNKRYLVDTSSARTLTLPASPTLGDTISIYDATGTAATNNITIARNSTNINGVADNAIIDVNQASSIFVYTGATVGWRFD